MSHGGSLHAGFGARPLVHLVLLPPQLDLQRRGAIDRVGDLAKPTSAPVFHLASG